MKKETISIIGPIGTFMYQNKQVNGVNLDDVVAQVTNLPTDTEELTIEVATPGGLIPVGKAMYGYLKSLNNKYKVVMKQVGEIASIGTYFWFASPNRLALKGINPRTQKPYGFNVHNPWNTHTEGDAAAHEEEALKLRAEENQMAAFYSENTGLPVEAVLPLMGVNAKFPAERAVELKFATETYEALNQAAYTPMTTEEKKSYVQELLDGIKSLVKGGRLNMDEPPAPPATPPGDEPTLIGKPVLIDGVAPKDGTYTIVAGLITEVKPIEAKKEDAPPPPPTPPVNFQALDEAFSATLEKALTAQKVAFDKEIVELKKQIKVVHAPAGFVPENRSDDVKEWYRSLNANEHAVMKKENPEKFRRLFYAKFNKEPEM